MLPTCQNDPPQCDCVQFAHGVTDDGKSILPDLIVGRDIVGRVDVAFVNLVLRHELINFDDPSALNLNSVEFLVLNEEVLAFRDFITSSSVLPRDHLAGFRIDILLLQTMTRLSIDPIETDFFAV